VFNLQGSEIIFILLLALVVLGPEKLPGAIRKFTQVYGELRKMGTGFQTELKSALDEPMREMRETADLLREQADPSKLLGSDAASSSSSESEAERMRRERARAQAIGDQRAAERMAPGSESDVDSSDEAGADDRASEPVAGAENVEHAEQAQPTDQDEPSDVTAPTPAEHESADVDEWADPIDLESARERRQNGEASA
jgi:sec-independent protein translocase protein TatB